MGAGMNQVAATLAIHNVITTPVILVEMQYMLEEAQANPIQGSCSEELVRRFADKRTLIHEVPVR